MKGYGLRAQEPSRETQISRQIFKRNLHASLHWSCALEFPPMSVPLWPMRNVLWASHVLIGSCKQGTLLVAHCVFPGWTLGGASDLRWWKEEDDSNYGSLTKQKQNKIEAIKGLTLFFLAGQLNVLTCETNAKSVKEYRKATSKELSSMEHLVFDYSMTKMIHLRMLSFKRLFCVKPIIAAIFFIQGEGKEKLQTPITLKKI